MLFSERKRDQETAEREAAGEDLWVDYIEPHARIRLTEIAIIFNTGLSDQHVSMGVQVARVLRARLGHSTSDRITVALADDDAVAILNWLGAAHIVIKDKLGTKAADHFALLVNDVFRQERIAFKFVDGSIVEFASDELNVEVVEPAVRLLVGKKFDAAHGAYMDALKEITEGNPGDAITDAGTALQEALKALGCEGNSLGRQLADAKKRGLLAGHDQSLTDAIHRAIDWASADRSESGDGHKYTEAAIADAWLMVHIVGALIVRLADGAPRGSAE